MRHAIHGVVRRTKIQKGLSPTIYHRMGAFNAQLVKAGVARGEGCTQIKARESDRSDGKRTSSTVRSRNQGAHRRLMEDQAKSKPTIEWFSAAPSGRDPAGGQSADFEPVSRRRRPAVMPPKRSSAGVEQVPRRPRGGPYREDGP